MRRGGLFQSVKTEGGLLPGDILEQVALQDPALAGTSPASYHLDRKDEITEAVNRSFAKLCARFAAFQEARSRLPKGDLGTTLTRERFLLPLFQELGYGRLPGLPALTIEDRTFPISHGYHKSPIHLLGCAVSLDRLQRGVAGAAGSSPHGLLQECLNASDDHLWGFLSNGLLLRILRDHHSLTRQAYVEFDLVALFEGEQFNDFRLLWLVCHQSRVEAARPEECILEQWFQQAKVAGVAALDRLRGGVEEAIRILGRGFLRHRKNRPLRAALQAGTLKPEDYYRELLRLVYRVVFLFVAEERNLLLDPGADEAAKERYNRHYGTSRIRRLADKMRGGPHGDLWRRLRLVLAKLATGYPGLALPALGGFLFQQRGPLERYELENGDLLKAFRALCFVRAGGVVRPVSWAALAADELGSVYESLMEYHPVLKASDFQDSRGWQATAAIESPKLSAAKGRRREAQILDCNAASFDLKQAAGNERKTTGSYYTPSQLVASLLDTALEPVLDETERRAAKEKRNVAEALLDLKVVDPACGSGHFLVAAARRIARRIAVAGTGGREPSPPELQSAMRKVVSRSVYGVDLNPMAVELCKVALWMEALEPGKPLTFLDAHIQCGNALLGAFPKGLADGIPDDAWKPITGDDPETAKALKRRNRDERGGQGSLFAAYAETGGDVLESLAAEIASFEAAPDESLAEVEAKEAAFGKLRASLSRSWFSADLWSAAFVWPKQPGKPAAAAPTHEAWLRYAEDPDSCPEETRAECERLAATYRWFHWHLAFPAVFRQGAPPDPTTGWAGGFDIVLGNPPWERVKLQQKEFFAAREQAVAKARNKAAREKLIAKIERDRPELWREYQEALRLAEGTSLFVRAGGRFPLCGRGDINTYTVFAELNRSLARGRVGCIVPSGIASDDTTKHFFADLVASDSLRSLFDFENRTKIFPGIDSRLKFSLLTLGRGRQPARFAFFLHGTGDLADEGRVVKLSSDEIALINPNTRTCPIFRSRRDAELTKLIYRRVPVLVNEQATGRGMVTSRETGAALAADDSARYGSKIAGPTARPQATPKLHLVEPPEEDRSDPGNPWGVTFLAMLHMSNDSALFRTRAELEAAGYRLQGNHFVRRKERWLPLYEAKMVHHFDHRFSGYADVAQGSKSTQLPRTPASRHQDPDFVPLPRYWVPEQAVEQKLAKKGWTRGWLLGWRDICRSTDERTVIAAVVPRVGVGNKIPLILLAPTQSLDPYCLQANLSTLPYDYAARQKVGGTTLNFFIFKQLPVLPPAAYDARCPWASRGTIADWIRPRVLELTYTAWDLKPFAEDLGYDGPPFAWDEARRFRLRCELDAAFFHLYLGTPAEYRALAGRELLADLATPRDAVAYIMDTFPIVRRHDEKSHGTYRTKDTILRLYDELAT